MFSAETPENINLTASGGAFIEPPKVLSGL